MFKKFRVIKKILVEGEVIGMDEGEFEFHLNGGLIKIYDKSYMKRFLLYLGGHNPDFPWASREIKLNMFHKWYLKKLYRKRQMMDDKLIILTEKSLIDKFVSGT